MTEFKEEDINNIVQQYQVKVAGTEEYCREQLTKIIAVIDHIKKVDVEALPKVDLNHVVSNIHEWCREWTNARGKDLPTIWQAQWTQQFVQHMENLLESVELFINKSKAKQDAGKTNARFDYDDMKLKYMQWLQFIFDVPSLDDHNMQYNKKDDSAGVQMLVLQDTQFNQILYHAGVNILWLDDNYFDQSFHALPALFGDMDKFYNAILKKLSESDSRESTPETQPREQSIEPSSHEDPMFTQELQMKAWLHQLQHIFSDEST